MSFSEDIIQKAKSLQRSIILPEAHDVRIIKAAHTLIRQNTVSNLILLGNKNIITQKIKENNCSLLLKHSSVLIIDPSFHSKKLEYAHILYELRKAKGMTEEEALKNIVYPIQFAAMMVKKKQVHAMIAGACTTTADVLRAALRIIKCSPHSKIVSSYFVIEVHNYKSDTDELFIFSDCAIIPKPTAEELSYIAINAAQSCKTLLGVDPQIAMLSFSTKGSANHEEVEKVIEATKRVKHHDPSLKIDGELQFDAAINPRVAQSKAPLSPVAGKANVFIFPDLSSGNIGYKIAQQIGKAKAYGPFIQGLSAPISDLSRGCSEKEIIISSAVTLCQERQI